jgi:transcriptional regulator with XRE-family HTH domain
VLRGPCDDRDVSSAGRRIAIHRRRRGLSQAALAGLVGRSESWLSQVERGVRSVDRLSLLLDLAEVLRVDLEALTGRPGPNAAGDTSSRDDIEEIRRSLARYSAVTTGGPGEAPSSATEELSARAARIHVRYQAAEYGRALRALPALLVAADRAWMTADGPQERLVGCVSVYVVCAKLLTKLGSRDLAAIVADRAVMAAGVQGSLASQGLAIYQVVSALLLADRTGEAGTLAVTMAERLTPHVRDDEPSLLSITGALWLIAGVIAGRQMDRAQAQDRLGRADALATMLGSDANHSWTAFGPTNVAVHRVSVAAEMGDPAEALAAAAAIDLDRLPVGLRSRRAQVHLDLAWAHSRRKRDAEATLHLLEAERAAPESIRYNVTARETLHDLLSRQRRTTTRTLTDLATRAQVVSVR